ncbi:MAG: repair protein RecO protein [Parcubacteria group bacterium GW2011_GWA1_49_11]|uniref:DNA repair protein RecO n=1 Tax=Candidatus Yanofskybacteria bacterium RIFCSPHIGHO2_01_FULL_48_25b TaxID=1802672 RepID=A0A1F8F314_9BACT|nr:MAG: repair protein RecO protein [Parcubacteria group bacterium GW2011_GWA1_49_11]OGN07058.1 MAG: DNA repair protein RecO [Candidatus Yanofskybacteria bacterium RIFCSPHIGHO2_01_FULL_48_25b]
MRFIVAQVLIAITVRTKAIVIKKTPANEYDQIVDLYSEDFGAMRAIAKGICRPKSVQSLHLETLNLVEFEVIHGKVWPIISSAVMLNQHRNIKDSLPKLAAAQFFTEVLDKIAYENEKDAELWNFLNTMLADFNNADDTQVLPVHGAEVMKLFKDNQSRFLKVLGYDHAFLAGGDFDLDAFFVNTVGRPLSSLNFLYEVTK